MASYLSRKIEEKVLPPYTCILPYMEGQRCRPFDVEISRKELLFPSPNLSKACGVYIAPNIYDTIRGPMQYQVILFCIWSISVHLTHCNVKRTIFLRRLLLNRLIPSYMSVMWPRSPVSVHKS